MGRLFSLTGLVVAVGACSAAASAQAEVSGSCVHDGRRVALVDGVAWLEPVPPGSDRPPAIRLAVASFDFVDDDVARAQDREEAFRDLSLGKEGSARFELTLRDDVAVRQYLWMSPGTSLSYASNRIGDFRPGQTQPGRISGSYRFTPAHGQGVDCRFAFDVAVLGDPGDAPPPPGLPLPADGGAPGAAYLALNRALQALDIDALISLLPADRAAEMREGRGTPEFERTMALVRAISPTQLKITGGRQDGERAWVEFTAVEGDDPRVGTAEMKMESGRWVMVQENTHDP